MKVADQVVVVFGLAMFVMFVPPGFAARKRLAVCPDDAFTYILLNGTRECRPCSSCQPGHGVIRRCSWFADTVCRLCPPATYSPSSSFNGGCLHCKTCGKYRPVVRPCSSTSDALCDNKCIHGYFYSLLDQDCLACSQCQYYPDYIESSIRVAECARSGMPYDRQCWPLPPPTTETQYSSQYAQDQALYSSYLSQPPDLSPDVLDLEDVAYDQISSSDLVWYSKPSDETRSSVGWKLNVSEGRIPTLVYQTRTSRALTTTPAFHLGHGDESRILTVVLALIGSLLGIVTLVVALMMVFRYRSSKSNSDYRRMNVDEEIYYKAEPQTFV